MATCIMCGKGVESYPGYVTDGIVAVCNECAGANSLARIITRIENEGISANLKSVFSEPVVIDASLVNQTEKPVAVIDSRDIDSEQYKPGSPFMEEVKEYLESNANSPRVELDKSVLDARASLVNQTDEEHKPQGYIENCPLLPCDGCHLYYAELDSCMIGEDGVMLTDEETEKLRGAGVLEV